MTTKNIKIYGYEPPGSFSLFAYDLNRLGLTILGTILSQKGYEVKLYCQRLNKKTKREFLDADYVLFSLITCTANLGYQFADEIKYLSKKLNIKTPVLIAGGIDPTFRPEEALEHFDYVLRGEAEESLPRLIQTLQKNESIDNIPGLSYLKDGQTIHNLIGKPVENLDEIPFPDWSLMVDMPKYGILELQTSRGCPNHCKFCTVWKMFGNRVRYYSAAKVFDYLNQQFSAPNFSYSANPLIKIWQKIICNYKQLFHKTPTKIFFCDDDANLSPSFRQLLEIMKKNGWKIPWSTQMTEHVFKDDKLIDLMEATGCEMVYIGRESLVKESLAEANKKHNRLAPEELKEGIKKLNKKGILIYLMFVVGFDHDTKESIRYIAQFAREAGLSLIQISILTPLPGSDDFYEMKKNNRIFDYDWRKYSGLYALFDPKNMSAYELQKEHFKAVWSFYSWRNRWELFKVLVSSILHYKFWWDLTKFSGLWSFKVLIGQFLKKKTKTWLHLRAIKESANLQDRFIKIFAKNLAFKKMREWKALRITKEHLALLKRRTNIYITNK